MMTERRTAEHETTRSVLTRVLGRIFFLPFICLLAFPAGGAEKKGEHPLLPGVRSAEVWNAEWPGTMHDKLLTGFSPLNCGMRESPQLWATIHTGGEAACAAFLPDAEDKNFLLVQDSALRRIDSSGQVVWTQPGRQLLFHDRLHGDNRYTLGALHGNQLTLMDPETGETFWQQRIEGTLDAGKVRVAKVHPDFPGKQIVVFPQYANVAYLFAFPTGQREPKQVWRTTEAEVANWPEQADHGVAALVEPDGSTIWNVRHHTINQFDPRSGKRLRQFEFESGKAKRRNYGPTILGQSTNGTPLLAILSQHVEHHLTGLTRRVSESLALVLDRFFSSVYDPPTFGVSARFVAGGLGDANGDGGLDVVYSLRVAQPRLETQTIFCDVGSGREQVLPDVWLAGVVDIDGDGRKEILAYDDSKAEMPESGTLQIFRFDAEGKLVGIHTRPHSALVLRPQSPTEQPSEAAWCNLKPETPIVLSAPGHSGVLVKDSASRRTKLLGLQNGKILESDFAAIRFEDKPLAIGKWDDQDPGHLVVQSAEGKLRVVSFAGKKQFELPITDGGMPQVSAADLNGDGKCELIVHTPLGRLAVYSFNAKGEARVLWTAPFTGQNWRLSIPARDMDGDGRPDVLGTGRTDDGRLAVRLYSARGKMIWESPLPFPGSGTIGGWIVGNFLGCPGIFVSVQQDLAREESYMLDGKTGRVVWTGRPQKTPDGQVRACNPVGIPTAFDADGDGREDLVLDYRDFVAIQRGTDGAFIRELLTMPTVPAGWRMAYNSFIPIFKPSESRPHFLVPFGHGGVGLLANNLHDEVWSHKPYYDTPAKVGMVDVDGDGRMEAGYEEARSGWFVCRDLWSGVEKWRLKLDGQGYGPAITADFDGDGKGEFLIGDYCIGTDNQGKGVIKWRTNLQNGGWPAIADLDGDGLGEIIVPCSDGTVRVFKASAKQN